ncbi:hypothetical protein [Salipaludibacillus aurantiacus]|uniref:Uncharacterized protein n=1 Tax=Salipaludibacillus aurantiacus TaxID=1601833 RepID=A0A1H9W2U3_9BACI|nr:hypothetical protein [Salipaludibacillus aurantiacus]SES28114.1 hypothetical protein SAMN05518684_11419 [Salipaludibacillus aurantiacus]
MGIRTPNTTLTTGTLFRNEETDLVFISLFNQDPAQTHTVTVSVLDWQNTCDPTEFNKFAYLCGELFIPPSGNGSSAGTLQNNNNGDYTPPVDDPPITTPFTFAIPPLSHLVIHATPSDPIAPAPPAPLYEVRVRVPVVPTDPIIPPNPIFPVVVNTWGISFAGVIQTGNTVLQHQLVQSFDIT